LEVVYISCTDRDVESESSKQVLKTPFLAESQPSRTLMRAQAVWLVVYLKLPKIPREGTQMLKRLARRMLMVQVFERIDHKFNSRVWESGSACTPSLITPYRGFRKPATARNQSKERTSLIDADGAQTEIQIRPRDDRQVHQPATPSFSICKPESKFHRLRKCSETIKPYALYEGTRFESRHSRS